MSDADISTLTTAYTVPAGSEARLTASFCNRSTSATATVQLWVVPQGESRGDQHLKESGTTLGLAGTAQAVLERSFVAPTGCIVYVQASTANVSCQVQGDVVSPDTFGVTDGTSSITNGTNWSYFSTLLKKDQNGQVSLSFNSSSSGTVSSVSHIATIPSGYRPPSSDVIYVNGYFYLGSTTITYPVSITIEGSSGRIYITQFTSVPVTVADPCTVRFTVSYFT